MNTREQFEHVRSKRKNPFSLRVRLTAFVTVELLICIPLAYGIDALVKNVLQLPFEIPLFLDMVFVCLLVGLLVTGLLSRYFFNPIKKLRGAMDQVADGDFSIRLEEKSSSREIMEIYTGFNLMAHELSATEILQTDFVSNVSHEFKTPINAIEGYSTLLQGSDNLDRDQQEYVEKILFNTNRLSRLVGNILLLSKIENQEIQTHQTSFRLDEQIRQSIVALESAWTAKDLELDVDLEDITYTGNESLMHHVWDNLIGNAIKFNPQCGLLKISLKKVGKHVIFTVTDSGPGLSEEAIKHLFDKFYQADTTRKEEGNGLGLALVKRILTIVGGDISADNLACGGCTFTVKLKA